MKDDQIIRGAGMVAVVVAYGLFVALNGKHTLVVLNYELSPLVGVFGSIIVLALPETIDTLPFGPTRET